MDGIASTRAEANNHLQRLREARGIQADYNDVSDSVLVSSLNEALNLLSDQLYTTPTHFLLELIQNADDNTFALGTLPKIHLSLYTKAGKGVFRCDCNEIGFTSRHLDALTRVGKSTKKAAGGRKGYIGEKGIGFKSVFKVADVVHVASGCYEFKFDRRETIGMMLPILSDFPPNDRVSGHTQFLLEIKRNEDYGQIRDDLRSLKSETLLFLRKLKQVGVTINGQRRSYTLLPNEFDSNFGGETATVFGVSKQPDWTKTTTYVIERQTVENLPPDPRREGVTTSEVMVAFTVKDRITPIIEAQQVFAFLPIQEFGFKFLIHADFLLTASRESLEYYCPWNQALREGIKVAVVKAICSRFMHLDEDEDSRGLCYSWPMYLTRQQSGLPFWDSLHSSILRALHSEKVLQSRDRQSVRDFQAPKFVRYVPDEYRFEGETLFDLPSINKRHLSFAYDHVREPLMRYIWVFQLSVSELCEEFCQWVARFGIAGLKQKPNEWHSRIAAIFYQKADNRIKLKLKQLPIIPLRNGSWVSAMETHLYLPSQDENEHVPSGINISIVAQDTVQDASRRRLLEFLDIKEYDSQRVCQLIFELHRKLASDSISTGRLMKDLIDDAVYLFKHRSKLYNMDLQQIFFAINKGGQVFMQRLPRIYLSDPKSEYSIIAKYKNIPGSPFAVLMDGYDAAFHESDATAFREWILRSSTTFATIPDLVWNAMLTPEWDFLCNQNVLDLLHVVRDHFLSTRLLHPKLIEAVPKLQLRCLDGESRALGNLAVPTLDLKRHCSHLDFADLPEPTLQKWSFLSEFGMITSPGTNAVLRELQALRQIPVRDIDARAIRDLYEALNSVKSASGDQIVRTFESEPLVFIPRPKPRWLSHHDCVWAASKLLTRVVKLRTYYGNCEVLFRSLLGVKEAGTQHVVDEFCDPTPTEVGNTEQTFKNMLFLLSQFHKISNLTRNQIYKIRSASVFPILTKTLTPAEGLARIEMRSLDDKDWYIPNIVTFEAAFRGKVNMLALSVQSAKKLQHLFEVLWCEEKFLSDAVTRTVEPHGIIVRNVREEQDLRIRLRYMSRVVEGGSDLEFPDISLIRVWSVPSIRVRMSVDDVEVSTDDELVTILENTEIDIYLREGIPKSRHTEVTYELVKHFKETIRFDEKLTALISLVMTAPIPSLPGILDKHDIPLPESSHDAVDVGSGEETPDPDDYQALDETGSVDRDGYGGSHGSQISRDSAVSGTEGFPDDETVVTPMASGYTDAERWSSSSHTSRTALRTHSTPLRDLMPSHQTRSDSTVQRARNFRLSSAEAAPPIQYHSGSTATPLSTSLPIRSRAPGINRDETEYSQPSIMPATGASYRRSSGVGGRAEWESSSFTSRRESCGAQSGCGTDDTNEIRARGIGYLGELFVFEMFAQHIDDWNFECWTSRLRSEAGHPRFQGLERDFSDFTYVDASGQMRAMLRDVGIETNAAWSNATKFHLEVKSTLGSCAEPMFVSQNQVDKMRDFHGTADNAYILLRVFDLDDGRNIGIKFFDDPWSLYMDDVLKFRSDQGYKVYQ